MKLYGSITSPFVRRVRYLCHELGQSFELVDSLTDAGQSAMREKKPNLEGALRRDRWAGYLG